MAVVTELVIDGTGATRGAQEYERAMDTAQRAMQRGLGAMSMDASKARDSIVSLGASIVGLAAGGVIAAAVTAFAQMTRELAGFEQTARRAGLALSEFQALRGAAALKGVAGENFDASIQKMAKAFNDARREETDLSKLLDANNVKFKQGTQLVIDMNKGLEIAADLIRRASSEQDKIKIAKAFGIDENLIPMLEGGVGALRQLAEQARNSGAVISDEVIHKAAEFDRSWTRVIAEWSIRIKAAAVDAGEAIQEFGRQGGDLRQVRVGNLPLIPKELKLDTDELIHTWQTFLGLLEHVPGLSGIKSALGDIGKVIDGLISDADRLNAAFADVAKTFSSVPMPRDRPGDAPGATVIPLDKTAFDRQIESINRHTAAIEADAKAAGMGAAAHARLRAEFSLREALVRDGITDTETQNQKLRQQEDVLKRAEDAALALARARVGSNIDFNRQTALLSPQDRQIAQQLKELYGNDVPAALASSEAAAMRFNLALQEINNSIRNTAASFATTFVQGILEGKSAMEAFGSAAKQAGNALISGGFQQITQGNIAIGGAMVGAGILGNLIGGSADKERKRQEQQRESQQKLQERLDALRERQFMAGFDTSTQEGALRQFDFQAAQQRKEAKSALGPASGLLGLFGVSQTPEQVELERTLAAERTAIIKRFADQAIEQEKRRAEAVRDITESLEDRAFRAANDNSTLQGQLAEFDRDTLRERERLERDFAELLPQLDRTRLAEREAIERDFAEAAKQRAQSLSDQLFVELQDQSTVEGQLAVLDLQRQRAHEEEIRNGGEAINEVEQLFAVRRFNIIQDSNNKILQEQKRAEQERQELLNRAAANIVDYLNNLRSGPGSTLAPSAVLANAQAAYNANLLLAQAGNLDAQNKFVSLADNLEKAARAFFGSAAGYQSIRDQIVAQGLALPAVQASTDPIVNALRDVLAEQIRTTGAANDTRTSVDTNNNLVTHSNVIEADQKTALDAQKAVLDLIQSMTVATRDNTATANTLQQTANNISSAINGLAVSQVDLLTALKSLNTIAAGQLELLNSQLSGGSVTVTTPGFTSPFPGLIPGTPSSTATISNNMITALNKIVVNTARTATSTDWLATKWVAPAGGIVNGANSTGGGVLHSGGWVPGSGDLNMTMQGGEFAIRREVARMNSAWLPAFNRTGQVPVANDNSAVLAELRALRRENAAMQQQIARLTHEVGEKVAGAIGGQTNQLKGEQKQAALRGERDKAA